MHQKLAYETIFSYDFYDWFYVPLNTYFDQSAGSSHGVKLYMATFAKSELSETKLHVTTCAM